MSNFEHPVHVILVTINSSIKFESQWLLLSFVGSEETESTSAPAGSVAENENSNSSNSDDQRPLLSRIDCKRKAEILSKESGKIGVTITTSSPTTPSSPPAKVCMIKILFVGLFIDCW